MTITTLLTSAIIIILPAGSTIPGLGECHKPYGGAYVEQSGTIYVCDHKYNDIEDQIKYHELGHFFWNKYMTQAQRDEYTRAFNSAKDFHRDYSKTNVGEDFADNFMLLSLKLNHNKKLDKRISLIRKYLKNASK